MRIAIVEDDEKDLERLKKFLNQYGKANGMVFSVQEFHTGLEFLSNYHPFFDVVFMDIEVPVLNGMETAKALYELDKNICIVFCTNMAQYAIKGYEVNAVDFIVKPVSYTIFQNKMQKIVAKAAARREHEIFLNIEGSLVRLKVSEILYVESDKHYLTYHTKEKLYVVRGTMQEIESELQAHGFFRCISGCLVNLEYIKEIQSLSIVMSNGEELPLARQRRKKFLESFMLYLGKRG